jgi:uncharacterized membrane protein YagU involved in acid resistance
MSEFQSALSKLSQSNGSSGNGQESQQSGEEDSDDATMKTAEKVSEVVFRRPLSKQEKKSAGPVVHYLFGGMMGALYGAAVEWDPQLRLGLGAPFGMALFAVADEAIVPALGLSKAPTEYPVSKHAYAAASHAVYGVTTEVVRKLTRFLL